MLFYIFNSRMQRVSHVDAVGMKDAMEYAKKHFPGGAIEKALTKREQAQKQYDDEADIWAGVNPR